MRKLLYPILALVLALGIALPVMTPVLANPGPLEYSPTRYPATGEAEVAQGGNISFDFSITADSGTNKVWVPGPYDSISPYAELPTAWLSFSPSSLTMTAPQTGTTTLTITVPGDAPTGIYAKKVKFNPTSTPASGPGSGINVFIKVTEGAGGAADIEAPTVDIDVSDTMISEADDGGTFDVIATFSEAMDTTVTPTISFDSDVEASGTLAFSSDEWSDEDKVYTATYDVADVDEEVAGVDVSVGGAKDLAGNLQYPDPTTGADLFDVDTIAPFITITTPVGQYLLNEPVSANWTVTDDGSGVNWTATYGDVDDGDPIDTSAVGQYFFYVYAEDNAGNVAQLTALYSVVYQFGGFLPPLVINGQGNGLFKAGSTIPVKFQLTDYYGNPVGTASGTASINTVPLASADIRYDATAMQYIANLKTPKGAGAGPYVITVNLNDGSSRTIGVTLW
jgi:hypothetical protein